MEGVRKEIGQECMTCGSCVHGWNDLQDWCIISNLFVFCCCMPVYCTYVEESLHLTLEAIIEGAGQLRYLLRPTAVTKQGNVATIAAIYLIFS